MNISVTRPVYVIIRWKGSASTAVALCASSHERWPFFGRKVKKSLKMRRCVTMPRQDRHQHEHRAQAHDPARPQRRHVVQVEVQPVEELAAARGARLADLLAGGRVDHGRRRSAPGRALRLHARRVGPRHAHAVRLALGGQGDEPARAVGGALLQQRHGVRGGHLGRPRRGAAPDAAPASSRA